MGLPCIIPGRNELRINPKTIPETSFPHHQQHHPSSLVHVNRGIGSNMKAGSRPVSGQAWPPSPGAFFNTCILQWNFSDEAFWRSPCMAAVLDISKSIALAGWKEAGIPTIFDLNS